MLKAIILFLLIALLMLLAGQARALGVFTHEAIIDAAWDSSLVPFLKKRYPAATVEELKRAHAHAYGGAVAPDMGYYPSGSKLFTNLVHYVRSGEMVNALLKEASTLNELAFALGFLSHYHADNFGHHMATNRTVPMLYPKVQRRHGNYVTYADDALSHMRTEFGFDVLELASGNYASQSYREYIGFEVDTAVLSRAFTAVYGLDIYAVHDQHFYRSVETFRWLVANVLPLMTRQAWATKKKAIRAADSTATAQGFNYKMRQRVYNKNFGTGYKRPGFFPTIFSFFIRVLPKVGPLAPLKFRVPGKEAEHYFVQSFDTTLYHYRRHLNQLYTKPPTMPDINYDTGVPTALCDYSLADATYTQLLLAWQKKGLQTMPAALRADVLKFYVKTKAPPLPNQCDEFWQALYELRAE